MQLVRRSGLAHRVIGATLALKLLRKLTKVSSAAHDQGSSRGFELEWVVLCPSVIPPGPTALGSGRELRQLEMLDHRWLSLAQRTRPIGTVKFYPRFAREGKDDQG
jgi:hypothetical protein